MRFVAVGLSVWLVLLGTSLFSGCRFGFREDQSDDENMGGVSGDGDSAPPDPPPPSGDGDGDEAPGDGDAPPEDDAGSLGTDAGMQPNYELPDGGADAPDDAGSEEIDASLPPGALAVSIAPESITGLRGGAGGSTFAEDCPENYAIVGYQGYVSSDSYSWVMRVQAMCARLSVESGATSVTVGKPIALFEHGTDGNVSWQRPCPAGSVVVGFSGRTGNFLDELVLHCAPLTVAQGVDGPSIGVGGVSTLAPVGGGGGTAFSPAMCPAGQVAYGHEGRSGQWVDALGFACGSLDLTL